MATEVVSIVDPDNGTGTDYTSLSAWESGEQGDLTGVRDEISIARCRSSSGSADTTNVDVNGWTTSSTQYVKIYCDSADSGGRHPGYWSTSHYRLDSGGIEDLAISEDNVRVDGLQIKSDNASHTGAIFIDSITSGDIRISNCIVNGKDYVNGFNAGIRNNAPATFRIWNCVVYGDGSAGVGYYIRNASTVAYMYNCLGIDCDRNYRFRDPGLQVTLKNCAGKDGVTQDFYFQSGTFDVSYCVSSDDTADDQGGTGNVINETGWSFEGETTGDFRLASDDTACIDNGTDLSSDTYIPFSDSIEGNTRSGTWDVGPSEYVAAGSTYTLDAAAGSMTIGGTAADLLFNRLIGANAGNIALTGTAADLFFNRLISAEPGSIATAGQDSSLLYNRAIDAEAGAITLTGTAAGLLFDRLLSAEAGAYILTGFDADLVYGSTTVLTAEAGAYTVTGSDAALLYNRLVSAEAGAITLTGFDATLTYTPVGAYSLTAEAGAMTLTGQDAGLLYHRIMAAEAGAIVITGTDAGLYFNRAIDAEAGAIVITGNDVDLLRAAQIVADAGAVTLTGFAATLTYSGALIPQGRVAVTLTARQPGATLTARQPGVTLTAR